MICVVLPALFFPAEISPGRITKNSFFDAGNELSIAVFFSIDQLIGWNLDSSSPWVKRIFIIPIKTGCQAKSNLQTIAIFKNNGRITQKQ